MTGYKNKSNNIPLKLKESYSNGTLIPVIGAGLSKPFGLPDWMELLGLICDRFNLPQENKQTILELCDRGSYVDALSTLISCAFGKTNEDIQSAVAEIFKRRIDEQKGNVPSLKDLEIENNYGDVFKHDKFKTVLTTNYDEIIADYAPSSYSQSLIRKFACTQDIGRVNNIIYLHGRISEPTSIILAKADYNTAYSDESFRTRLGALALGRTFLFLGFSFQDEYIKKFLETISAGCEITHYALMDTGSVNALGGDGISKLRADYKTEIISYDPSSNGHVKSIRELLNDICSDEKSQNCECELAIDNMPEPLNTSYFGRESFLGRIEDLLDNNQPIISIYADFGEGKTSLASTLINKIAPNYHGVKKIFYWKFEGQSNISEFFESAINFFSGEECSCADKNLSEMLLKCLKKNKSILILDDFESLYVNGGEMDGQVKTFITTAARNGLGHCGGLIILLSQRCVDDLERYKGNSLYSNSEINVELPGISDAECIKIFKLNRITGTEEQLKRAADELNKNPLSITLLSRALKNKYACDPSIERRNEINLPKKEMDMNLYSYMDKGLKEFFEKVCFFRHSFKTDDVNQIFRKFGYKEGNINYFWGSLTEGGYIYENKSKKDFSVCPAIRDQVYFGYQENDREAFIESNKIFGEYYESKFRGNFSTKESLSGISTIRAMEPLYDAIFYYTHAGQYKRAFEILLKDICRKREFFSQRVLGAFSNDIFAISQFFDMQNDWEPKCKDQLDEKEIAWLYSVLAYLKRNVGSLGESIKFRELELKLYKQLNEYNWLACDSVHFARVYMLKCQRQLAYDTFKQAEYYLEKAKEGNTTGDSQMDINRLEPYLNLRWAHFYYSIGCKEKAIEYTGKVNAESLNSATDIFYYLLIRITYCTPDYIEEIKTYFKKYETEYKQNYARKFRYFLAELLKLKQGQLSESLTSYSEDYFKAILSGFDKSIEESKKIQRIDQYLDMLLLYMDAILEYIPAGCSEANEKFKELSSEVDCILKIYDIPIYRAQHIILRMRLAKANSSHEEYENLAKELDENSEYKPFFREKLDDLGMN